MTRNLCRCRFIVHTPDWSALCLMPLPFCQ